MTRPDDLDLRRDHASGAPANQLDQEPHGRGPQLVIVAIAVLVACLAIAGWYWWSSDDEEGTGAVTEAPTETGVDPSTTLGTGEAMDLPPLDELDPVLRSMLETLSARPELARLLATDNLLRRFVVSVENIGRGVSPVRQLQGVSVDGAFSVDRPNSESAVSPASFARYDGMTRTVAEIDREGLARIYGQLKPRLAEAYGELGGEGTFDMAMERAIVHLLQVSPDQARGRVRPVKGLTYAWTSADTENLSSAQKQLLRMGPENARRVQTTLRQLALALGIPAERLPQADGQ